MTQDTSKEIISIKKRPSGRVFKIALKSCAFFTYSLVVTVAFNAACCKAVAQSVVFHRGMSRRFISP